MKVSCCVWALPGSPERVLQQAAASGFDAVDVRPFFAALAARAAELSTSCVAISHGAPEGTRLDSDDASSVSAAMAYAERGLEYAADIDATTAYVVPDSDAGSDSLDRYGRSLATLGNRASELNIRLCVEHMPGSALPTIAATLNFLHNLDHPNLSLLLDIGHAQMSREDPAAAIAAAGARLGYVHLDDNDGIGDQHLSLTDGILTLTELRGTLKAVAAGPYNGPVSLELHPDLADPLSALMQSLRLVREQTEIF